MDGSRRKSDPPFFHPDVNDSQTIPLPFLSLDSIQGCRIWHPNWVRLAPNGINLGLFKISFSTFWLGEPKCTETDLKKSQICPIRGQSDPIWMPNCTSRHWVSLNWPCERGKRERFYHYTRSEQPAPTSWKQDVDKTIMCPDLSLT